MKHTFIILILFCSAQILSQNSTHVYGVLSNDEMEMSSYKLDKQADAVVLFDIGKSKFIDSEGGYNIKFTRHKRIKIFEKSAIKFSEISIPYYQDGHGKSETIASIEAITYNIKEGKTTKTTLTPSSIHEEKVSEKWKNKKFVFPNVQPGSILEFRYTLITPFHFNLPDWTFQDKIPTIYSEYDVRMIPFYEYIFLAQGINQFDQQTSVVNPEKRSWGNVVMSHGQNVGNGIIFQENIHTYILKNIPAFRDESYISSINNYLIKMDFQLSKFNSPAGGSEDIISSWRDLTRSLIKHTDFGKYQRGCIRFAKKILDTDLAVEELNGRERAGVVINFIKQNYVWNGISSKYASQSPSEFYTKKTGNSADFNLFLTALLNTAGVDAYPVILSTRSHGNINLDYPFDHFTNYILTYVDTDAPFLADGTEELLRYNRIPIRCLNGKGLVINDSKQEEWVDLKNKILSSTRYVVSSKILPKTTKIVNKIFIHATEYDAYLLRNSFKNDTAALKEKYTKKSNEILSLNTSYYKKINLPYVIYFKGTSEFDQIGDKLVFNPFHNLAITENSLTQKKRSYPVDFVYRTNQEFDISIEFPENYAVLNPAAPYAIDDDLVEIKIEYTTSQKGINIKGHYTLKKSLYGPEEYPQIQSHISSIVEKFNAVLVLEPVK